MSLSRFLKIPDAAFTPALLHIEMLSYVIEEFQTEIENLSYPDGRNAEKLVQYLIDKYPHRFRMYGSAQELLENVRIFTNFPASIRVFKVDNAPYTTPPTIFYSMKNEKFICISDLFVILQNMSYQDSDPRRLLLAMAFHLQSKEEQLGDRVEFVRFDEKVLDEIEKEIKLVMADKQLMAESHRKMLAGEYDIKDVLRCGKAMYPNHDDIPENSERYKKLKSRFEKGNADIIAEELGLFIYAMCQVIKKHREMFLPYSKSYSNPITVRVFEDGDQRFVLKVELSNALFLKGVISVPMTEGRAFHTMSMEQVLKNFDTKNIEFIRYPIHRAKHRMVPVKICKPSGFNLCILAIDAFFEFMREAIFSFKMFQEPSSPRHRLYAIEFFETTKTMPFFVAIESINVLKNSWRDMVGNVQKTAVRNAKKDGFTLQNLKNELKHLGLLKTFPKIQDYADVVYSEVVKHKKEEFLRTCDLYDAIEHCQLNCILNMFPELSEFVHNQKGCHRVYGYKCEECEKIQKTGNNAEKNKKKKEKQKQAKLAQKTLEDSEAKIVPEDVKTSEDNPEVEKDDVKIQKTSEVAPGLQKISEDVSDSKKDSEAPIAKNEIQKAPDVIVKSPESDQKTLGIRNSTNNEKLENLEKELLNLKADHDKIIGEKNEEIQGLKSEISACNKEKEELNFENVKIQKELQKKILENQDSRIQNSFNNEKLENLEKELLNIKADHDKILGEKNEEIQGLKSEISAHKEKLVMEKIKNQEGIQKKILENQELQLEAQKLNAKLELKGKMMEQLFEQLANASISEDKNKKKYSNPDTVGSSQQHLDS